MAISPISTNSLSSPNVLNPYAKTDQTSTVPQINQNAQKAPQAAKTDTVTISQQALQMASNDSGTKETGESKTKQQYEAVSGKK